VQSYQGARFSFRGVLKGRLLLATKLLPTRYFFSTWLVSTAALAKDVVRFRWRFGADRIAVLSSMVSLLGPLLRERKTLFRNAKNSSQEQLDFMIRLTDNNLGAA
jgi:hypothetical protein